MSRPNETETARYMLALLNMLGEERAVTYDEIARVLGVSREYAWSLVVTLATCATSHEDYIYLREGADRAMVDVPLPKLSSPVRLTAPEAYALDTAFDRAGIPSDDPLRQKLASAGFSQEVDKDGIERIFDAVDKTVDGGVFSALSSAIEQGNLVTFDHCHSQTHAITHRTVEPHALTYQGSCWYLEGFCRERGAMRRFRVDGVTNVRDAGPYKERAFDLSTPERVLDEAAAPRAILDVDEAAFDADVYNWAGARKATPSEAAGRVAGPGRVLMSVPRNAGRWLARRIAAHGDGVVVVDPPELAAEVGRLAEEDLAAYLRP